MMKVSDVVYVGIHLNAESKKKLLMKFLELDDQIVGKYSKFYCDHVTLEFGEAVTFESLGKLGKLVNLDSVGEFVIDDKIAYVPVQLDGVPHAHITVASDSMTPPKYSKDHLMDHAYVGQFSNDLQLSGTICAYMRDGQITDHLL